MTEGDTTRVYGRAGADGLAAAVTIVDPRAWTAIFRRSGIGLGEAFVEGWWTSDDPVDAVRLLARNMMRLDRLRASLNLLRRRAPGRAERAPTATDDRLNVRAHYDAGNAFFELFLDPTMAYSSAIFATPETGLEAAQMAKFDAICDALSLDASAHVLEIGTGWGGFAVHAARRHGCRVTTTTISAEQYDFASRRVADAGLDATVTVLAEDYRDVRGSFSHIVSIEMIEAVDWRMYDTFFAACRRLLEPGGSMAMQAIVMDDAAHQRAKWSDDFIKRYVFPQGCIPSVAALTDSAGRFGLKQVSLRSIGDHYVRTLAEWRQTLAARRNAAIELGYDERGLRLWEYYFAYCEAGFAEGRIDDVHLVLRGA